MMLDRPGRRSPVLSFLEKLFARSEALKSRQIRLFFFIISFLFCSSTRRLHSVVLRYISLRHRKRQDQRQWRSAISTRNPLERDGAHDSWPRAREPRTPQQVTATCDAVIERGRAPRPSRRAFFFNFVGGQAEACPPLTISANDARLGPRAQGDALCPRLRRSPSTAAPEIGCSTEEQPHGYKNQEFEHRLPKPSALDLRRYPAAFDERARRDLEAAS